MELPGSFEWVDHGWGPALRCPPLAASADHLFTTRHLSLGRRTGSDGPGWETLARTIGVDEPSLVSIHQVHGTDVQVLRRGDRRATAGTVTADIVVTDDPAVALAVQVADCVPLLIVDPRRGAVAAAHAGWRGTAAGVARAAVEAMSRAFGSVPADLLAAVGPSIGPCCYEVGGEVRERFGAHAGSWFTAGPRGRPHLDLWRATSDQLLAAGLLPAHVHVSRLCTATWPAFFYSYRREGPGTGRMAGVIRARGSGV